MNSLKTWIALFTLTLGLVCLGPRAQAQSDNSSGSGIQSPSAAASKAEVEQLRQELASQRRTIEQLRNLVEQLVDVNSRPASPANGGTARLINATYPLPASAPAVDAEAAPAADPVVLYQKPTDKKDSGAPITAGWNGEHFFIKSADGQFQIQPYGYVQMDYLSYIGDASPANSFSLRRGRFGFQGNYGDHYQFGLLIDGATTTGSVLRDIYLNAKYNNAIQVQVGQFKEPFAQEELQGDTNLDFAERGLQSALYPSAATTFRSLGAVIHGDINGGAVQYWAGAFNGHGYVTNNTTSVPESVGRVRFYPWRNQKDSALHELAFGASIAYSKSRGLSNELSAPMTPPDNAFTWFPQFPVNGNVWRYEGEFTYVKGPWAIRDEYVGAQYDRTGVGSLQLGGLGFANLPNIRYQGWNSSATYLLTRERRPENGTPRVLHPVFGPETEKGGGRGWGAWELAFRYSGLQANEPGIFFNNVQTPQNVATFNRHTDEFTFGVNWYLNYWVRFQSNFSVDRLKDPSTIGTPAQNFYVFDQRLQYRF
ncbi:MAG TPA: porin [Candidatus Acidoferrum sp.]|nr:porin [Candidatus Acidoferrum sp.]